MIEMSKKYVTLADGLPVRILCVDRKGTDVFPVVGLVDRGTVEVLMTWSAKGHCVSLRDWDLVEAT